MDVVFNWLPRLAGLGIRTVIGKYIQIKSENQKLIFEVKLLKYSKLIEAFQNSVSAHSEHAKQIVVSAQQQVELVGTEEIISINFQICFEAFKTFPERNPYCYLT
jgi:hypothetical protein